MLKFDDQFPLHRKVAALSDSAFRLHVEAIFWSRRNLTDGFLPAADAHVISRVRDSLKAASEAVTRGVWHRVVNGEVPCDECAARHSEGPLADGWVIHGYADWQDTRAKARAKSEVKAKAGKAGGIASGRSRRLRANGPSPPRSRGKANGKQSASGLLPNERTPSALSRAENARDAATQASSPRASPQPEPAEPEVAKRYAAQARANIRPPKGKP